MATHVHGAFCPNVRASSFTDHHVFVFHVAYLANGGPADLQHHSELTGRKPDGGILPFFSHELSSSARGTDHLTAFARLELNVVDHCAHRNVFQGQGVAWFDIGVQEPDSTMSPTFKPTGAKM